MIVFGSFPYVALLERSDAFVAPYIDGIENVVFLELLRRGYDVNIGKLAEKEIDFVARNMDGLTYFQVSASVLDSSTLARELDPLKQIPDHHPKVLLTLDEIGSGSNYDGIRQMNLLDWLLEA